MTVGSMESVQLFDAGKKGRGLRATKELHAGEVVFAEPSFSAVVFDSWTNQVCHSCFRRQAQLHRCALCKFAHYCDRTCQTACWEEHRQECGAIRKLGKVPGEKVRLAARLLWRLHKDSGVASDSQLVAVERLEDHQSHLAEEQRQQRQSHVDALLQYWGGGSRGRSADLVSRIFGIIQCNGFPLTDQRGLQAVGVGLFPNLSLVNHDCWPNCSAVLNHGDQSAVSSALHSQRRVELRAVGAVAAGEELTLSYVDFLQLSARRQQELQDNFHFLCSCDTCSRNATDHLMGAAESEGAKLEEVSSCSLDFLRRMESARREQDPREVLRLCRACLERQHGVLADTHLLRLRVLRLASEALAHLGSFSEAADCAGRMLEGYTKLCPPHSAQLGVAVMRGGVARWHAGQTAAAHGLVCRAYGILMVTHGPNHPITRDLEAMRVQTEAELKRKDGREQ